ncbi:UDPglucose--hexose-1-phosphate uridylyltransferase [Caldalkalibacillus uzonensis]|uniref:Galactose-1-phosphate uridylyltransferase n=1 Tax=Caldalkalibacillus uzonensis TaxID=353224 RepID=A0ABU0CQG4_9BACI|nr:galactose-1-phosphate uridylyltransferase [Caldalkalibacillus uzonensis]MDQ0338648.1 UDPglucose--hexose-1-phosphate uridylyltransferase [Caldalkalibacillus uzonensis]
MAELRYNPLLRDWTMVASHRQHRPHLPKDYCPFCPGSGKVPDHYDVLKYDNDFPALSQIPPEPDDVGTGLYKVREAYGKCEVILYSPEHSTTLPELSVDHIVKLVELWTERFAALGNDPKIDYVLIFENRGEEVGVTMPHPHGQIYGYPYIPLKLRIELEACQAHHEQTGRCLICDMNREEQQFEQRIVMENEHFVCYLPFFTDYPYGVFIVSKSHQTALTDFSSEEKRSLAQILRDTTGAMDTLFDRLFPYMMCLHQRPTDGGYYEDYYHFHIEFYPPLRAKDKLKFNASSETGAWAPCNPMAVEETAGHLREAYARFKQKEGRG